MKDSRRSIRKPQSHKKTGLPPGQLVYIGKEKKEAITITVFEYNASRVEEKSFKKPEDIFQYKTSANNAWININGIHDIEIIEKIGKHFGISPLAMEDIVN